MKILSFSRLAFYFVYINLIHYPNRKLDKRQEKMRESRIMKKIIFLLPLIPSLSTMNCSVEIDNIHFLSHQHSTITVCLNTKSHSLIPPIQKTTTVT